MKRILVIALIVLLAFLPHKPEIAEEDPYKLGNTPGNIGEDGRAVEDEKFCYYAFGGRDDKAMYKASKDFKTVEKITNSMYGIGQLNVYGDYIYYCDGFPGCLQRMTVDGKRKKYITFRVVRNVVVSGNRVYYMISEFDDDWGKVYSCELDGRGKKFIAKAIAEFCVDADTIYYINRDDGDCLWEMDVSGENKRKLGTEAAVNINFDEKYIYYNEVEGFGIFKMDKQSLQSECINKEEHGLINLSGDWLYYCDDEDWLCRMTKDGKRKEMLLDARVGTINVVTDSVFFQLAEENYGRYRLDLKTKEVFPVSN